MKKKLLGLLMAMTMVASLAACGGSSNGAAAETTDAAAETTEEAAEATEEASEEPVAEGVDVTAIKQLTSRALPLP